MILVVHIILATVSIVYAFFAVIFPQKTKLPINYSLIIGTILSGGAAALANPEHLGKACIEGLVYLGIMATMLTASKKRTIDLR